MRIMPSADAVFRSAYRKALAPLTSGHIKCSDWCREHVRLPPESSSVEGPFNPWPHQNAWLNLMTGDGTPRRVAVKKSARVGYTQVSVAATLYALAYTRRHVAFNQPTEADAKAFSKENVRPAIQYCAPAREAMDEAVDKRSEHTILNTKIAGKILRISGSVAASAFRRFSSDYVILDEIAAYKRDVGGEGSPIRLAERSVRLSPFRRVIVGSTPGEVDSCAISDEYAESRLRLTFAIPCPHCGVKSPLRWQDIRYATPEEEPDIEARAATAQMVCRECGALWGHESLAAACAEGYWRHEDADRYKGAWIDESGRRPFLRSADGDALPWPPTVAFHIWAGYSIGVHWSEMVLAYLRAIGDPEAMKTWTNTWQGEAWSPEATSLEASDLKAMATRMPDGAPDWVQNVYATVDVQAGTAGAGWLSVMVTGWGWRDSFAILERREIHGRVDVSDGEGWRDLADWLKSKPTWNGIGISAVGVDCGYDPGIVFDALKTIRQTAHGRVYPVRGSHSADHPIIKTGMRRGAGGTRGRRIHFVGTHKTKDFIVGRIAGTKQEGEWPKVAFNSDLPNEVYEELSAEKRVMEYRAGRHRQMWKAVRARNEALDTAVYAYGVHKIYRPDILTPEAWQKELERRAEEDHRPKVSVAERYAL